MYPGVDVTHYLPMTRYQLHWPPVESRYGLGMVWIRRNITGQLTGLLISSLHWHSMMERILSSEYTITFPLTVLGSKFISIRGVWIPFENLTVPSSLWDASIINSDSFSSQVSFAGSKWLKDSGLSKGISLLLNHHLISSCLLLKSISFAKVFPQSAINQDSISGAANPTCFATFSAPETLSIALIKSFSREIESLQSRSSITNIKSGTPLRRAMASSDLICWARLFHVLPRLVIFLGIPYLGPGFVL